MLPGQLFAALHGSLTVVVLFYDCILFDACVASLLFQTVGGECAMPLCLSLLPVRDLVL